jgi:hypothetical protein
MQQKLANSKSQQLTLAGRITLCKPVLAKVPIYTMQSTIVPKSVCVAVEKLSRAFIWGYSEAMERAHLVRWDSVCKPKMEGGLGIKRMHDASSKQGFFLMKLG